MNTKTCSKCKKDIPLSSFHTNRARLGGLCSHCKLCLKQYYEENKEKIAIRNKRYNEARKEENAAYQKQNRKTHSEEISAQRKGYRTMHKAENNAAVAKRHAWKLNATPSWANDDNIKAFYASSQRVQRCLGIKMHVDHIYPLQGKTCCGLHVENNLQIITAEENLSKHNSMPEDFYGKDRDF